jgi:methyl-accepting chemotaxis protein
MATAEARETVLRSRGELLEEVTRSVEQLGASIDQIQVSALAQGAGSSDLAKIRSELDVGLEVARRVQERMEDLDRRVAER